MKRKIILLFCCAIALLAGYNLISLDSSSLYSFNDKGELLRPMNYREWIFAGNISTPRDIDPDALFPDTQFVYIDPESYQHWKKTGTFRDGTILVKEIAWSTKAKLPVGTGFVVDQYHSLSAAVKDSKRFPDTTGNWNYFKWSNPNQPDLSLTSPPLGKTCSGCHEKYAPDGGAFYNYETVLRDSKGSGNIGPENFPIRKGRLE
ncbi:cytochrome P460 family protein [Serratia marcescens]|nr:cytochrome P460 family protein [Serratia marcescens]